MRAAVGDLLNVWFLVSLALTLFFFIWVEAPFVTIFWGILRPVAIAFLLFLAVRMLPLERLLTRAQGTRFEGFANALGVAVKALQKAN